MTKEAMANKSVFTEEIEQASPVRRAGKKLPSVEIPKEKGKKQKNVREKFNCYIYEVLQQVHQDLGISKKAIAIMDCFVNDFLDQLVGEAHKLTIRAKQSTITSREIQTCARLLLPKELAMIAISEGVEAVTRFTTE